MTVEIRKPWQHIAIGIILCLIADVMYVTNNFLVRHFMIVSSEFMLQRGPLQILIYGLVSSLKGSSFSPDSSLSKLLVAALAILLSLGTFCVVMAVRLMPIGEFIVLIYASPAVTVLLQAVVSKLRHGRPFLGSTQVLKLLLVATLLAGTTLVMQPDAIFDSSANEGIANVTEMSEEIQEEVEESGEELYPLYWIGVGLSLFSAVCIGTIHVLISLVRKFQSLRPTPVMIFRRTSLCFMSVAHLHFSRS